MICPHCLKSIDDNASVCPGCGGYVGSRERAAHSEFVFCEGCGARLSPQDRTCPKCRRPAPGILSTSAAASDLAAGKTASFPRVSSSDIETEQERFAFASAENGEPRFEEPIVRAPVFAEDADPDVTATVKPPLRRLRPRRPSRRALAAACAAALLVFAVFFVVRDPLNAMPGFYDGIRGAAHDMFPSRESGSVSGGAAGSKSSAENSDSAPDSATEPAALTDDEALSRLSGIYQRIGGFQATIREVITEYNGSFISKDHDKRDRAAQPAYAMRDSVKRTIDEINGLKLAEGSPYALDVEHMRSLATWMYERVDVLCRSWDISLALAVGERPSRHKEEISQPLRDALDDSGMNQSLVLFEKNYASWKPVDRAS